MTLWLLVAAPSAVALLTGSLSALAGSPFNWRQALLVSLGYTFGNQLNDALSWWSPQSAPSWLAKGPASSSALRAVAVVLVYVLLATLNPASDILQPARVQISGHALAPCRRAAAAVSYRRSGAGSTRARSARSSR